MKIVVDGVVSRMPGCSARLLILLCRPALEEIVKGENMEDSGRDSETMGN